MPARRTNLQRIIGGLYNGRHVCDDCLSVESCVMPRQTVNRLCRENSHLISECRDRPCDGQCRKGNKILRFIPQPNKEDDVDGEPAVADPTTEAAIAVPKVDDLLGANEPIVDGDPAKQVLPIAHFSRRDYLHGSFNEIIVRALNLPQDDYLGRLSLDGLMDLKAITSNIHAMITLRLTFALVDWLQTRLKLTPEQARAINDAADAAKPFESGFDLESMTPNFIAEVKGNIPVKGGSAFGAAQVKGLTNDVRQMFGLPAIGKTAETMSDNSKIHRPNLAEALKFLGVYDSPQVRDAAKKWMKSFCKAHEKLKVELASEVENYKADTVYVVFLTLDNTPPVFPVETVTE